MDRKEIEEDIRKIKEHCSRFGRKPSFNEIEWVCTHALKQMNEATNLRNRVQELEGGVLGDAVESLKHRANHGIWHNDPFVWDKVQIYEKVLKGGRADGLQP